MEENVSARAHGNELILELQGSWIGATLELKEVAHWITDGQPYHGTTICGNIITVNAGRKGSTDVSESFKKEISGGSAVNSLGHTNIPDKMNFAIKVNLIVCNSNHLNTKLELIIAQSHTEGHNDWWVGSRYINDDSYIVVEDNGDKNDIMSFHGIDTNKFRCGDSFLMWMKHIANFHMLSDLSIPGTHDSGTYNIPPGIAKCQNYSLTEQLKSGIRFFDIRLNENLEVCHDVIHCHISFDNVIEDFRNFLAKYPNQTILMSVKNEKGNFGTNLTDKIEEIENNYPSLFYRKNKVPCLADTRGKIVVFRRFPLPSGKKDEWGINIYNDWPDDTTASFTNTAGDCFYVEDRYFDASETIHDTKEKENAVKSAIKEAGNSELGNYMFIIFNSVAGRLSHTPWDYSWGGAGIDPAMNPSLSEILSNTAKDKRVGIILMDFYNKHDSDDKCNLVKKIIEHNPTD